MQAHVVRREACETSAEADTGLHCRKGSGGTGKGSTGRGDGAKRPAKRSKQSYGGEAPRKKKK